VADGSEPRAESDRFVLDQLWRRGDEIKKIHKDWHDNDPEFSSQEKTRPFVRLMLIADRWGEREIGLDVKADEVRAVFEEGHVIRHIPFDTIYSSGRGLVARQLQGNDPSNLTLTWRLGTNFVSDVIIPLNLYEVNNPGELVSCLSGYKEIENFAEILRKYQPGILRVVDLNWLLTLLVGVAEIQTRLCKLAGWTEDYYFKVKLLNSWRTIPYFDVPQVIERLEKFGVPMCLDSSVSLPKGFGPDCYSRTTWHLGDNEIGNIYFQAMMFFEPLAEAYGLPSCWRPDDPEAASTYFNALHDAGRRAFEVQMLRDHPPRSGVVDRIAAFFRTGQWR
jgi:hypothetical protein